MKLELVALVGVKDVRSVTLAHGSDRLLVGRSEGPVLVLDARTGKEVGKLPKGCSVLELDTQGMLAVVDEDGKSRGGRHEWNVSLWDLVKVKRIATIAKNHPDDRVSAEAFGATRLLCLRIKKNALSLCSFDRRGKAIEARSLGKVPLPFHVAMTANEQAAAHCYFTGAAQLFDLRTGKGQKLAGGTLRIGRNHDKGVSRLAFDSSGDHLVYASHGSGTVHVWSTRTRKPVAGKWSKIAMTEVYLFGDSLGIAWSGSDGAKMTAFSLTGKGAPRVFQTSPEPALFAQLGDGRHFACAGASGHHVIGARSRGVTLWDFSTGKRVASAKPAGLTAVNCLTASPGRVAISDAKAGIAVFAVA